MHVLICNERLLSRFGVDRLLLMLGRGLVQAGHRVTFAALRLEASPVGSVSPYYHVVPVPPSADVMSGERAAAVWLDENWTSIAAENTPDVILTGGWPFFCVAAFAARRGMPSVFIDAGAVPHEGLAGTALKVQRDIRRVRALTLPEFSAIFPISDFVRDSQTIPDRGHAVGVHTILLGADHLHTPWSETKPREQKDEIVYRELHSRFNRGERMLFALGRFESSGYKNSAATFTILRSVRRVVPEARLLVLESAEALRIPDDLREVVVPIGFVSDRMLSETIGCCAVGLAPSHWEGFNLPLVEMQWEGRPVLALDVGAHPEVICHPWFLCTDVVEMAEKAQALLLGTAPPGAMHPGQFARFRDRFRWRDTLGKYLRQLGTVVQSRGRCQHGTPPPYVLLDRAGDAESGDVIQGFADNREIQLVNVDWEEPVVGYVPEGTRSLGLRQGGTEAPHLILERLLERVAASGSRVVLMLCEAEGKARSRILWARARGFAVVVVVAEGRPSAPAADLADAVWSISENRTDELARLLMDLR